VFENADLRQVFPKECKHSAGRISQLFVKSVSFLSLGVSWLSLDRRTLRLRPTRKNPPENYGKENQTTVAAFLPWRDS